MQMLIQDRHQNYSPMSLSNTRIAEREANQSIRIPYAGAWLLEGAGLPRNAAALSATRAPPHRARCQ